MKIDNAPCRGCQDRVVEPNCHMTCERYLAFVEELERIKEEQKKEKESEYVNYHNRMKYLEGRRKRELIR